MSRITLFAGVLRAATAMALVLGAADSAAGAKPAAKPPAPAAPAAPVQSAVGPTIQHIAITGTQRIEPATVLSYIALREGEPFTPLGGDIALKALYGTGLFADVKINYDQATSTVNIAVVEN